MVPQQSYIEKESDGVYKVHAFDLFGWAGKWIIGPLVALVHLLFLMMNQDNVILNMGGRRVAYSKAIVLGGCIFYGFALSATIFWFLQFGLKLRIKKLEERVKDLETDLAIARRDKDKYQRAAARVIVPYRMDALVNKGLEEFAGTSVNAATVGTAPH